MDAVKRASFASKQLPGGPAPLASFEDLPSDELESPEDNNQNPGDPENEHNPIEKSNSSNTITSVYTPETLTASSQSTPRIESDFDSQFTLTPTDSSRTPLNIDYHTGSFSSLSKTDTVSVKHKKGSVASLDNFDAANDENDKTSSPIDVSPNVEIKAPNIGPHHGKGKTSRKKSRSDIGDKDYTEVKSKDKGKFLSMFKGKKSGKNSNYVTSPDSVPVEPKSNLLENANISPNIDKENELPKQIELHPMQNDLDKSTNIQNGNYKTSDNKCDIKNALNIAEKEYNIVSCESEKDVKKTNNEENGQKMEDEVESSLESSECLSEVGFEAKAKLLAEKGYEIEAETLIPQDSSEVDEDSVIEMTPLLFKIPNQISLMSRQQRQDVTTIPIERPRSTTPINVAPLEAFIRSASPSSESKAEKIKLSLPGEQFLGRLKSPKRSSSKSWTDFCVEVLHSPHLQKRDDFPEQIEDVFNSAETETDKISCWDKFEISDKQWVTFDSNAGKEKVPDLFQNIALSEKEILDDRDGLESQQTDKQFNKCPCHCHFQGCDNVYIYNNKTDEDFASDDMSPKIDLFSDKCECQCHEKYLHLWSPSNFIKEVDFSAKTTQLSNIDHTFSSEEI